MGCARRPVGQPSLLSRVHVAAHVFFLDGRNVSMRQPASEIGKTFAAELGTTDTCCVFQNRNRSRPPGSGWQVNATALRQTQDAIVVWVDWTRSRQHGRDVSPRNDYVELTPRSGESVPLDTIVLGPIPSGRSCDATKMGLQVKNGVRLRAADGGKEHCAGGRRMTVGSQASESIIPRSSHRSTSPAEPFGADGDDSGGGTGGTVGG